MKFLILATTALFMITACSGQDTEIVGNATDSTQTQPPAQEQTNTDRAPVNADTATDNFERNDYSDPANWLCHPDKNEGDACDTDLTTTIIAANGTTTIETFTAADDPAFDCFYIYPTVSFDTTPNSDMNPGPEERAVIANQFARYGEVCRLYAPIYRQRTISELRRVMLGGPETSNMAMRYADVRDSWTAYLENHNNGRGIVLVGHSQGAGMIFDLIENEIAGTPVENQIISFQPIGSTATVDRAGTRNGVPICESDSDTGCIVNYESFRADMTPPATTRFGRNSAEGQAICVDPTKLVGAKYATNYLGARNILAQPYDFGTDITTPFVSLPNFISTSCQVNETHHWLAVEINADAGDPRTDDIPGDVVVDGNVLDDWGLHLIDMNIVMGDLLVLTRRQGEAWLTANNR